MLLIDPEANHFPGSVPVFHQSASMLCAKHTGVAAGLRQAICQISNCDTTPISKNDIARTAVACLLDPARHDGAVYEITGSDLLSFREIAAIASEVYGVPIRYVSVSVEERYAMLDAMGVPRKYAEGMDGHPDAHLWCSEEMVTADIAFQAGYHGILTHHVEFITGAKPMSLRGVFELCKGKDYNDC
jgi:NAD(P)H dehydrogenase (quinone)